MNIQNSSKLLFSSIRYWTGKGLLTEIAAVYMHLGLVFYLYCINLEHSVGSFRIKGISSLQSAVFCVHTYKRLLKESCSNFFFLVHYKLKRGIENTLQLHDSTLGGAQHDASQIFVGKCWKYLTVVWLLNLYLHHFNKLLVVCTCYFQCSAQILSLWVKKLSDVSYYQQ